METAQEFFDRCTVWGQPPMRHPELGECLEWTGTKVMKGYGAAGFDARTTTAHRFAWLTFVGPIPKGYVVDHLCHNRGCVNVAHLEPVTPAENSRRGVAWAKAGDDPVDDTYNPRWLDPQPLVEILEGLARYVGVIP